MTKILLAAISAIAVGASPCAAQNAGCAVCRNRPKTFTMVDPCANVCTAPRARTGLQGQ